MVLQYLYAVGIFVAGLLIGQHFSTRHPSLENSERLSIAKESFKKPKCPTLAPNIHDLNPAYPPHVVHQELSSQLIGNYEFHYAKLPFLQHFLDILKSDVPDYNANLVVIVGFERGDEAVEVFRAFPDLRVHGFEAQKLWMDNWAKRLENEMNVNSEVGTRLKEQCTLTHAIVQETSKNSSVDFKIADVVETAPPIAMSSIIKEPVLLLSVDIDGYELSALKGSKEVIENPVLSPAFLLVEISYSIEDAKKEYSYGNLDEINTLKFLDERGYILFGICWWGTQHATKLHQIHNCKSLPADFQGYTKAVKDWMESDHIKWTIANVIAVKRGLFTDAQLQKLMSRYIKTVFSNPSQYVRIKRIVEREEQLRTS